MRKILKASAWRGQQYSERPSNLAAHQNPALSVGMMAKWVDPSVRADPASLYLQSQSLQIQLSEPWFQKSKEKTHTPSSPLSTRSLELDSNPDTGGRDPAKNLTSSVSLPALSIAESPMSKSPRKSPRGKVYTEGYSVHDHEPSGAFRPSRDKRPGLHGYSIKAHDASVAFRHCINKPHYIPRKTDSNVRLPALGSESKPKKSKSKRNSQSTKQKDFVSVQFRHQGETSKMHTSQAASLRDMTTEFRENATKFGDPAKDKKWLDKLSKRTEVVDSSAYNLFARKRFRTIRAIPNATSSSTPFSTTIAGTTSTQNAATNATITSTQNAATNAATSTQNRTTNASTTSTTNTTSTSTQHATVYIPTGHNADDVVPADVHQRMMAATSYSDFYNDDCEEDLNEEDMNEWDDQLQDEREIQDGWE